MELAQELVRCVMRSFYDTKHVLVIDALAIHSALRDDDLSHLMGMNTKELHKLCGKLREDRFLAVHTRSETKEGQQRPISRTYYYINYRETIDAIKWRMYNIDKAVQGTAVPADERKEFSCPRCRSQWTQMEVLTNFDNRGFLCHKCNSPLMRNEESTRGGHEQSTKLNAQFRFITDLLPKIDQLVIPDNTFEVALASARPVARDPLLNPANETAPTDSSAGKPTAVRGLAHTGPTSISVTVTSSDGLTAAEKAADQARKDKFAADNALPAHFTHSTVTGEKVVMTAPLHKSPQPVDINKDKKDIITTPSFSGDGEAIDSYFAQLKAEQAREAVMEQEEDFETDSDGDNEVKDDQDDDNESLVLEDMASIGSYGSTQPGSQRTDKKILQAGGLPSPLKRRGSTAPSSGTSTAAPSPGKGPRTPESARFTKKVKIAVPVPTRDEEESEEDVEFEDV